MKSSVASLFLAVSLTLMAATAPAQNKHRRANKSTVPEPRGVSVKICQGVPIPPGYVITGYLTTSSCPHGAYVITKQHNTDPQTSVATDETDSRQSDISSHATKKGDKGAATSAPIARNDTEPGSTPASNQKRYKEPQRASATKNNAREAAATSASVSRPRRVGAAEARGAGTTEAGTPETENEPPVLRGVDPRPAPGPPTLRGLTATNIPLGAATDEGDAANEAAAGPEEVGEGDVVRVDTALVTVPVSVLDRQGRFVPNLRKEDFTVSENDIEQSIAYFEPTEKPFTVALVLDTSASTHFHLSEIKEAAIAFATQLRPQDRILVVSFNDEVLLLTEATNDLSVVSTVIQQYASTGSSTRLYDAIDLVIKERLNKIKGRKAIVLFTDGVDTSSYLANYESTMKEIEELDALIYPIQYDTSDYQKAMQGMGSGVTVVTSGGNWPFGRSSSRVIYSGPTTTNGSPLPGTTKADYERANKYLHELAEKTGARLYQANDTAQLAQAFSRIAEELRRQYSIGYYPQSSAATSGERRQIRVRVKKPNLAVRARASYLRATSASPVQ